MKHKISVIMPVYNTPVDILSETIDSILNQSFEDFELIIIDDGSTNGCGSLCDKYKLMDNRIVVLHKKNGGICDARNWGLKYANSEYITFCDHDDIYAKDNLKRSFEIAETYNADMVVVGIQVIKEQRVFNEGRDYKARNKAELVNILGDILKDRLLETVWNVLYRKSILENIFFDTRFKYGQEDYNFNLSVIKKTNCFVSISDIMYQHIVRMGISTSSKLHRELCYDMAYTNNEIFNLINYYEYNCINNSRKIIEAEACQLKKCVAYAVKSGLTYYQFLEYVKKLKFHCIAVKPGIPFADAFVYYTLRRKKYKFLYFILKSKYLIKRV